VIDAGFHEAEAISGTSHGRHYPRGLQRQHLPLPCGEEKRRFMTCKICHRPIEFRNAESPDSWKIPGTPARCGDKRAKCIPWPAQVIIRLGSLPEYRLKTE
jgi:hypothetical protein